MNYFGSSNERLTLLELDQHSASQWVDMLLVRQAYLVIPLLGLSLPLLLFCCTYWGTASLLALFDYFQTLEGAGKFEEEDEVKVPLSLVGKYLKALVLSPQRDVFSTRLAYTLGSITCVCGLNREGILSEVFPYLVTDR